MFGEKHTWFSRKGWTVEQAAEVLDYARAKSRRLVFPDFWGKISLLKMAAKDLGNNGIPSADAARALGISSEGVDFGPCAYKSRPKLPFGHHPMLSQYPFVRQAIAYVPEVRELYHQRNHRDPLLG